MVFDEHNDDQSRQKLLDEIRRRAEEAELARIEVEEARFSRSFLSGDLTFPLAKSAVETVTLTDGLLHDNRGGERKELNGRSHASTNQAASENEIHRNKHQIEDLLSSARDKYEREDYDRALFDIQRITELNPDNAEAISFQREIVKAKTLSDQLRAEEHKRRRDEKESEMNKTLLPPPRKKIEIPESEEPFLKDVDAPRGKESETTKVEGTSRKQSVLKFSARTLLTLFAVGTALFVYTILRDTYFPQGTSIVVQAPITEQVDAYVAEGLRLDVIIHLSHLPTLRVYDARISSWSRTDYVLKWKISQVNGLFNLSYELFDATGKHRVVEDRRSLERGELARWPILVGESLASGLEIDPKPMQAAFSKTGMNQTGYDMYLLGRALLHQHGNVSYDSISGVLDRARNEAPSSPTIEATYGWANILHHASVADTSNVFLEEAKKSLQRAATLGGASAEVFRLWGVVSYFRSHYDEATRRLENAARISPSDGETHYWLALAYLRRGKIENALLSAQAATQFSPDQFSARSLLGMMYLFKNEPKSALNDGNGKSYFLFDSTGVIPDEYLTALVGVNQHERAIDILRKRAEEHPRDFIAQYDLGRMSQLAGKSRSDWEKSLKTCLSLIDDTLKTNPAWAFAYSYRGLAQTRLGLFPEGIKSNQKALDLSPKDILILYNAARLYALQQNRSQEASKYLNDAMTQRFSPAHILDLDLTRLRNHPEFFAKLDLRKD